MIKGNETEFAFSCIGKRFQKLVFVNKQENKKLAWGRVIGKIRSETIIFSFFSLLSLLFFFVCSLVWR